MFPFILAAALGFVTGSTAQTCDKCGQCLPGFSFPPVFVSEYVAKNPLYAQLVSPQSTFETVDSICFDFKGTGADDTALLRVSYTQTDMSVTSLVYTVKDRNPGTYLAFGSHVTSHVSSNNDIVSSNNDIVSSNNDIVSSNNDIVSSNNDIVSNNNDIVSGNNDIVSSNNDIVSSNNDIVSSNNDIVSSNNDIVSSNNDIVSGNNDIVSGNNDIVSSNNDIVSSNNDIVSSNNDNVSSNNDNSGPTLPKFDSSSAGVVAIEDYTLAHPCDSVYVYKRCCRVGCEQVIHKTWRKKFLQLSRLTKNRGPSMLQEGKENHLKQKDDHSELQRGHFSTLIEHSNLPLISPSLIASSSRFLRKKKRIIDRISRWDP
ncbi:hypothetical protein J6590_029125 [Homalodisca vitripennis]|nr:hypothetical protein J6590_029125 [Homalodisca vitripennis]